MTLAEEFGRLLTDARGDRSRRDLAGELGVSATTLLSIEHGRANPTLDRVERLAAAYGLEVHLSAAADVEVSP